MKIFKVLFIVLGVFFGISVSAWAAGLVVNVASPNGFDDTLVVQDALDKCVGHRGCTVQLAAGTYRTTQLFAGNFHGTFKGKGMDVTIIQALPLKGNTINKPISVQPPSVDYPYPYLICFFEGNIAVSDMTLKALETITMPGGWYGGDDTLLTFMFAMLQFMGQGPMNVAVERVGFESLYTESIPEFNLETGLSFEAYPQETSMLSGTFRVSACRFNTIEIGIWNLLMRNAHLTIGGSPSDGNVMRNCAAGGILYELDGSTVEYSHNDVSVTGPWDWAGAWIYQDSFLVSPTSFLIHHNKFKATGSYEDGVWIEDWGPFDGKGKKAACVISNNEFILEPSQGIPAYAGIQTDFTVGTVIFNNRIEGSGLSGISVEGDTRCLLIGNNVEQLTADKLIGLMINSWDPSNPVPANHCTVVGCNAKAIVYDEGVHNTILDLCNIQDNPTWPAIREAMKRIMDMIMLVHRP